MKHIRQKRTERKGAGRRVAAYTLTEGVVAIFTLGIMVLSLFTAFSTGFGLVSVARENLRATQILLQKTESIRLLNWTQILSTNDYLKPSFTDWFDPTASATNGRGTLYVGKISSSLPSGLPADYRNNMRVITVSVTWTNPPKWPSTTPLAHSRQMQTQVARSGMQNYIYQ